MTQANFPFVTGRHLRDAGMHTAITNAEQQIMDWPDEAMRALQMYLLDHPGQEFKAENVRIYAYEVLAVPYPPSEKAWGGIMLRASREGLIEKIGVGPVKTASSHMANAGDWRAV